jgi:hypothetical protein
MDCPICCRGFTKTSRSAIQCSGCEYSACKECLQQYLLMSTTSDQCPNCRREWDLEFLAKNFTKHWLSGPYRSHLEDLMFEHERAQLPHSQHLVENYRTFHDLTGKLRDTVQKKKRLRQELTQTEADAWNIRHRMQRIAQSRFASNGLGTETTTNHSRSSGRVFIRACPRNGCRGFLSTALKCGVCGGFACGECLEAKDGEHTCDQNNVATAKLIRSHTRPCPTCGISISKLDGCNQMWCSHCKNAFDWRSGQKIVGGVIHNPEYFRWLRENTSGEIPRNPHDNPCGAIADELVNMNNVLNVLRQYMNSHRSLCSSIMEQARHCRHTRHVTLRTLARPDEINDDDLNIDLRLRYLLNDINDEKFKRLLVGRNKKRQKELAIRYCLDAQVTAINDSLLGLLNHTDVIRCFTELETIYCFTKQRLDVLKKRFDCSVPEIPKPYQS